MVAAGIITYNPNVLRLKENIDSIINQVEVIYIYDNDSFNVNDIQVILNSYDDNKVVLLKSVKNVGIATGLNEIIKLCLNNDIKFLYTLDQDSVSSSNIISELMKCFKINNCAVGCPIVYDYRYNCDRPQLHNSFRDVEFCITSGSLVDVEVCHKIGNFDDYLFVGLVDNEFCYRLRNNGYKIIQNCSVILDHELGNIEQSNYKKFFLYLSRKLNISFFRKLSYKREVSPLRVYYVIRNMMYLRRKYTTKYNRDWGFRKMIITILSSLIRGNDKIKIFNAILKGLIEGNKIV